MWCAFKILLPWSKQISSCRHFFVDCNHCRNTAWYLFWDSWKYNAPVWNFWSWGNLSALQIQYDNHRTSSATNNCVIQWAQICTALPTQWEVVLCHPLGVVRCLLHVDYAGLGLDTFVEEIVSWWLLGFSKYFCSELMGIVVFYLYFVW
jgi:hypothetical protein